MSTKHLLLTEIKNNVHTKLLAVVLFYDDTHSIAPIALLIRFSTKPLGTKFKWPQTSRFNIVQPNWLTHILFQIKLINLFCGPTVLS